ncbi:MAG: hypothetical protein ACJ75F_10060 [Flavisolibacter sp.]|jgi:hypothetical protein
MQEELKPQKQRENEVDLGVFFTIAGKIFRSIGNFFVSIFKFLFTLLIAFFLLIKNNFLWLALSAILGFSVGLYKSFSSGPSYYAEMVVTTNFESSRFLYQKIDYFNALISGKQRSTLSKTFGLTSEQAAKLMSFKIRPIDDPLQSAKLYRDNFLEYRRNEIYGADTLWSKTIKYKDFVDRLTKFDYPQQIIRLYSRDPDIFSQVQQGLVNLIRSNPSLKQYRDANAEIWRKEEEILTSSLNGIDSLRGAYNKKIASTTPNSEPAGIFMAQSSQRAPEIELYDKELLLKDELSYIKRKRIEQNDIIQVNSDFNSVGTRVPKLDEDAVFYALIALITVFVIILLIKFYRYLNIVEKKQKAFPKN